MELILEAIELNHPLANNEKTYNVYLKDKTKNKPIFLVVENGGRQSFYFELSGDPKLIAKTFRRPILQYRLGKFTDEDKVTLGDIFMYGRFNLLVDDLN